jgi:hypothetical protein
VGGLGESDPGCIFVVKYVLLSVLMDYVGTGYASGVTCHTYST